MADAGIIILIILIFLIIIIVVIWKLLFGTPPEFKDRESAINARWEKKITELEKTYEIKLEKANSNLEKLTEQNKTHLEKLSKEWQVRYIRDIEELKKLFKESEKRIREKSVSSSRRTLVGKFIERFVPFLSGIRYSASDMHFIGQPIDYIVFDGLRDDKIKKVVFLEVKTGDSQLSKREKSLKEAIQRKKVSWEETRVNTDSKKKPDKEIASEEETIKELYDDIDKKIKNVKKGLDEEDLDEETDDTEDEDGDSFECPHCNENFVLEGREQREYEKRGYVEVECPNCGKSVSVGDEEENFEPGEYDATCPKCDEDFTLELDEGDDLRKGVRVECPNCKKTVVLKEEDIQ